jgi:hypothetical protein
MSAFFLCQEARYKDKDCCVTVLGKEQSHFQPPKQLKITKGHLQRYRNHRNVIAGMQPLVSVAYWFITRK